MKRSPARWLAYYYARLFAVSRLSAFHYFLLKMSLHGLGIMNYYDLSVSGERFVVDRILPRFVESSQPVFFDVGANRGEYSLMLKNAFPNAAIFAFEPHPKNFDLLSRLKMNNFLPFSLALGDIVGQSLLFDGEHSDLSVGASLHPEVINEFLKDGIISYVVNVETLESFANSKNIDRIDFLKIDTEGHELAVLRGAGEFLKNDRIDLIQFEFNEMNVVSRVFFGDFRKMLANYKLFRILPNGLLPVPDSPLLSELFGFQNILAVHKSRVHLLDAMI